MQDDKAGLALVRELTLGAHSGWDHLSAGMGRSLLACEQACAISRTARCVLPRSKEELLK